MLKFLEKIERYVIMTLIVMMSAVVITSTFELALVIWKEIFKNGGTSLELYNVLDIFGYFLLVLIGVELLEILRAYMIEDVIHVEVVFVVALIAIARKVIILDVKELPSLTLVGIGFIILVLSIGYYLIKRTHSEFRSLAREKDQ